MIADTATDKRRVLAATVYLGAAIASACCLHFVYSEFFDGRMTLAELRYPLASVLGAVVFVLASIFVFFTERLGYLLGLIAGFLVWPFFLLAEFSRYSFYNSWVALNMPGIHNEGTRLAGKLTIVVFIFLVLATSYSFLRMLPDHWQLGQLAVRDCVWPIVAFTIALVAVWFLSAVTPYRFPMYHRHQTGYPKLFILHVEKRGLQFHDTAVSIWRDGRCSIHRDNRQIFQYSFSSEIVQCSVPENIEARARTVINWSKWRTTSYPRYVPPRSWNSDGWFVYLDDPERADLIDVDRAAVPKEFLLWFDESQKWPHETGLHTIERDVCLGFCYDPTF